MEEIPQPSEEPYEPGDLVKIYLHLSDSDARFNGRDCKVLEVHRDDLSEETGRPLDKYLYTLRDRNSGDKLLISFRHRDLVPLNDQVKS